MRKGSSRSWRDRRTSSRCRASRQATATRRAAGKTSSQKYRGCAAVSVRTSNPVSMSALALQRLGAAGLPLGVLLALLGVERHVEFVHLRVLDLLRGAARAL